MARYNRHKPGSKAGRTRPKPWTKPTSKTVGRKRKRGRKSEAAKKQAVREAERATTVYRKRERIESKKIAQFHKRQQTREIEIVSRRSQGTKALIVARMPKIERKDYPVKPVSSTWIDQLGYDYSGKYAIMVTDGKIYHCYMDFLLFEDWYYAHSKGTFFNIKLKDKIRIMRVN